MDSTVNEHTAAGLPERSWHILKIFLWELQQDEENVKIDITERSKVLYQNDVIYLSFVICNCFWWYASLVDGIATCMECLCSLNNKMVLSIYMTGIKQKQKLNNKICKIVTCYCVTFSVYVFAFLLLLY